MNTQYLKQVTTGRVFVHSAQMAQRPDMVAYEGQVDAQGYAVAPGSASATVAQAKQALDPRVAAMIRAAAGQIPQEQWGKQIGNKPSLPKVKAVSAITGFPVSMVELLEAFGDDPAQAGEMESEEETETE